MNWADRKKHENLIKCSTSESTYILHLSFPPAAPFEISKTCKIQIIWKEDLGCAYLCYNVVKLVISGWCSEWFCLLVTVKIHYLNTTCRYGTSPSFKFLNPSYTFLKCKIFSAHLISFQGLKKVITDQFNNDLRLSMYYVLWCVQCVSVSKSSALAAVLWSVSLHPDQ